MGYAIRGLFKSGLFHSGPSKQADPSATVSEIENESQKPVSKKEPASSSTLNSIREEERCVSESFAGTCTSRESSEGPSKSAKGVTLRGLKKRIASFPDLKFRSSSSVSSAGTDQQEPNPLSNENLERPQMMSKNSNISIAQSPHASTRSLEKSPIINVTYDSFTSPELGSPRKQRESYFSERRHSGSLTKINTASSATSSLRGGMQTRVRKMMMRSNSDDCHSTLFASQNSSSSRVNDVQEAETAVRGPSFSRQRSRTVGASDYEDKGVPLRVSLGKQRIRSNSASKDNIVTDVTTRSSKTYLAPPVASSNLKQQNGLKQSFSSSRRGSLLVTALSSFVTLRSASMSSKCSSQKVHKTLENYPKPPEPADGDSEEKYLETISFYDKFIGAILAAEDDDFKRSCLHKFMKTEFDFSMEPLDISLRKLVMFLELPKESQQIDRFLDEFSKVYYEQNQDSCYWKSAEEVFFLTFSLLMLHTDAFNPNNKIKMTKQDFVKLMRDDSTSGRSLVPKEILEYYFDNITAREFSQCNTTCLSESKNLSPDGSNSQDHAEVIYSPKKIIHDGSLRKDEITSSSIANSDNVLTPLMHSRPNSVSTVNTSTTRGDAIDVYHHIISNSLSSVRLESPTGDHSSEDGEPVEEKTRNLQHSKYISIIQELKGGYLRLLKFSVENVLGPNIINVAPSDKEDNFRHLKIVQMGYIEEVLINRKFSIVGNVNRLVCKRFFGILTSSCFLLFNDADWIEPKLVIDQTTNISNYIIDWPGTVQAVHNYQCANLFAAEKNEPDKNSKAESKFDESSGNGYIMNLHSSNKKMMFACPSQQDRYNWIDAINSAAALDGCSIPLGTIPDTMTTVRKLSTAEKLEKFRNNRLAREKKFKDVKALIHLVSHTVPVNPRIRSHMSEYLTQLEKRFGWLKYEALRSDVLSEILQLAEAHTKEGTTESNHNDSVDSTFIFSESLEPCDSSVGSALDTTFEAEKFWPN
ncbi:LAFA_0G10330g1_1 [Lachancea sp. 'fantastica']|nr:LAFA_0G10330g1_1 [Lachancea sp. 'fantastica']